MSKSGSESSGSEVFRPDNEVVKLRAPQGKFRIVGFKEQAENGKGFLIRDEERQREASRTAAKKSKELQCAVYVYDDRGNCVYDVGAKITGGPEPHS